MYWYDIHIHTFATHLSSNWPFQKPAAEPLDTKTDHEEDRVRQESDQHSLLAQSPVREHLDTDTFATILLAAAVVMTSGRTAGEAVLEPQEYYVCG